MNSWKWKIHQVSRACAQVIQGRGLLSHATIIFTSIKDCSHLLYKNIAPRFNNKSSSPSTYLHLRRLRTKKKTTITTRWQAVTWQWYHLKSTVNPIPRPLDPLPSLIQTNNLNQNPVSRALHSSRMGIEKAPSQTTNAPSSWRTMQTTLKRTRSASTCALPPLIPFDVSRLYDINRGSGGCGHWSRVSDTSHNSRLVIIACNNVRGDWLCICVSGEGDFVRRL